MKCKQLKWLSAWTVIQNLDAHASKERDTISWLTEIQHTKEIKSGITITLNGTINNKQAILYEDTLN
jgi:hypothetical protein